MTLTIYRYDPMTGTAPMPAHQVKCASFNVVNTVVFVYSDSDSELPTLVVNAWDYLEVSEQ